MRHLLPRYLSGLCRKEGCKQGIGDSLSQYFFGCLYGRDCRHLRRLQAELFLSCLHGSSEKAVQLVLGLRVVHCRVGSSEIGTEVALGNFVVHCRIGSQETHHSIRITDPPPQTSGTKKPT